MLVLYRVGFAALGFVAAASDPESLEEQIQCQLKNFTPPHPEDSMVSETELRNGQPVIYGKDQVLVNGNGAGVNGSSQS